MGLYPIERSAIPPCVMPLTTKLQIPSLDLFEFSLSLLIDGYRCVRYVIKSIAITD